MTTPGLADSLVTARLTLRPFRFEGDENRWSRGVLIDEAYYGLLRTEWRPASKADET